MIFILLGSAAIAQTEITDMTAKKLFNSTRYIDAINQYEVLLKEEPKNTYYSYCLGLCYMNLGMDVNRIAIDYLATSVEGMNQFKNSTPNEAYYHYGQALIRGDQKEKAIEIYQNFANYLKEDIHFEKEELALNSFPNPRTDVATTDTSATYVHSDATPLHVSTDELDKLEMALGIIEDEIAKFKKEVAHK